MPSANGEMVKETSLKLYDMARAMIASRRQEPRDPGTDPTAALLAARVEGAPFPDEMILGTIRQELVVGIIAPTIVVVAVSRAPPTPRSRSMAAPFGKASRLRYCMPRRTGMRPCLSMRISST